MIVVNSVLGGMCLYLLFGWAADRFCEWGDAHDDAQYDWSDPDAPIGAAISRAGAPLLIRIIAPVVMGVAFAYLLFAVATARLIRPS